MMETDIPLVVPRRWAILVHRYTIELYFLLAFAISWVFWFIEPALRLKDPITATFFIQLGTYGPLFAAVFISALTNPERNRARLGPRLLAGGLALAAAVYANWPLAGAVLQEGARFTQVFLLILLTLIPGLVFFNAHSAIRGVQDLLQNLTCWPIRPLYWLTALLLMLALSLCGVFLTAWISGRALTFWLASFKSSPVLNNLALTFVATALYGGPLGEEAGWRGLALPRLQKRFDPLLASVLLGLAWALWHLPLHVSGYYSAVFGSLLTGLLLRAFSTIPLALIFTWLYNRTRGSLLVMVVLHTAVNMTSALIPPGTGMYIVVTIAVVIMVVVDRMYRAPEKVLPA
jgi:membrane protease YdiL (CAAX protease family)